MDIFIDLVIKVINFKVHCIITECRLKNVYLTFIFLINLITQMQIISFIIIKVMIFHISFFIVLLAFLERYYDQS